MDIITLLGSVWPDGNFWASVIRLFDVGSYAWTIILFTIVLKLVLSPLDFAQRYFTNKQTRAQAKLQPELEKLKKRYGQNQTLLYQKQNELYQKNNIKPTGSCIIMLVYMAVTLTVFLTLWSSLQSIAGFKIKNQFNELQTTYYNSYNAEYITGHLGIEFDEEFNSLTPEQKQERITNAESAIIKEMAGDENDEIKMQEATEALNILKTTCQENAQVKVVEYYKQIKDSFLWIRSIWRADSPLVNEIASYNDYKTSAGDSSVTEVEYNLVMGKLLNNYENSNSKNGYFILSIIVVAVSLLSQLVMRWTSKPKSKNGEKSAIQQPGFTKILMFIMPIAMLLFTINSSSIFAIYIITNSLITTLITPLTTIICNKIEDNKERKRQEEIKVDYRR